MAHRFISTAINLNESLQAGLNCCIHRGLLERPIVLPSPCTHRICTECLTEYLQVNGGQHFTCPLCRMVHNLPADWANQWFDRVLNGVTQELATSQSDIRKKVSDFVEQSYLQFSRPEQKLKITSIIPLHNPRLQENFNKCKRLLQCDEVVTLLHGTDRRAAFSIGGQGFSIPTTFERNQNNDNEGELKFGKAIYFAHAKKASEYGKNTFVLTDCILGRIQNTDVSELQLTPEIVHNRGYDTIYYYNPNEGAVNQEWVIYRSEQCLPLCIIEYEFLDAHSTDEEVIIKRIHDMNLLVPNYELLTNAALGTDNQCKEVLKLIGDGGSRNAPQATVVMRTLLTKLTKNQVIELFQRSNETIRILLLRAMWQTGRQEKALQEVIYNVVGVDLLLKLLKSSYADVSWRACGVLTNMAAYIKDVRQSLVAQEVLNQLMTILQRATRFQDKVCTLTVLNLFSDIAVTEYSAMRQKTNILDYLNENILDHNDEQIQESGNRLFCNIISKGTITPDWVKHGYKNIVAAPSMEPKPK